MSQKIIYKKGTALTGANTAAAEMAAEEVAAARDGERERVATEEVGAASAAADGARLTTKPVTTAKAVHTIEKKLISVIKRSIKDGAVKFDINFYDITDKLVGVYDSKIGTYTSINTNVGGMKKSRKMKKSKKINIKNSCYFRNKLKTY